MENVQFKVLNHNEMLQQPLDVQIATVNAIKETQVEERVWIKDPFIRAQLEETPDIESVGALYTPSWGHRWCEICVLFDLEGNPLSACRITSDEKDPRVITLTSMVTIKGNRRKGYGTELLTQVRNHYLSTGHTIINLNFNAHDPKVRAFYEKSGFIASLTYAACRIGV